MKNIYYQLWVDAIEFERSNNKGHRDWRVYTLIPISMIQGLTFLMVIIWLSVAGLNINIFFNIGLLSSAVLNKFVSGFTTLFLPFFILNYFLIFRGKRYEKLGKDYEYKKGKWYKFYLIFFGGICIVPLVLAKLLNLI
jgi:hypothetical protein